MEENSEAPPLVKQRELINSRNNLKLSTHKALRHT